MGNDTSYYANALYEVKNGSYTKYYWFGGRRVAMRTSAGVSYLYPDHLGSTIVTVGAAASAERYPLWGTARDASETVVTNYRFTGQREEASLGISYYGARWYEPNIGRLMQADRIVPKH